MDPSRKIQKEKLDVSLILFLRVIYRRVDLGIRKRTLYHCGASNETYRCDDHVTGLLVDGWSSEVVAEDLRLRTCRDLADPFDRGPSAPGCGSCFFFFYPMKC